MGHREEMLPVGALLLHGENPRLLEVGGSQLEIALRLAKQQRQRLVNLAVDIAARRLDPSTSLIVTPAPGPHESYVVLEGNRRLLALRALEDPEQVRGGLSQSQAAAITKVAAKYQGAPIDAVRCVVFDNDEESLAEAREWIDRRHTGENSGRGLVSWGGEETARFRGRIAEGALPPAEIQVLDIARGSGLLSAEAMRSRKPITTTLRRFVMTKAARAHLGIDIRRGEVSFVGDRGAAESAIAALVEDLLMVDRWGQSLSRLNAEQRVAFVRQVCGQRAAVATMEGQPVPAVGDSGTAGGSGGAGSSGGEPVGPPKPPAAPRAPREPKGLIPKGWSPPIPPGRVKEIVAEMRRLAVAEFPNACSVLLRVLIELSVDAYFEAAGGGPGVDAALSKKVKIAAQALRNADAITEQQKKAVLLAEERDTFLAESAVTMNQYVHNANVLPVASHLRAAWTARAALLAAIWTEVHKGGDGA